MSDEVRKIDPYRLLVKNPDSTFFLQAGGEMEEFGIHGGDTLVVDRQAEAPDGKMVIAVFGGDLRVMRLVRKDGRAFLTADGKEMEITGLEHAYVWGVLMWVLREA